MSTFAILQPFFVLEFFPAIALVPLHVLCSMHSMKLKNPNAVHDSDKNYLPLTVTMTTTTAIQAYRISVWDLRTCHSNTTRHSECTSKLIWKIATQLSKSFKHNCFLFQANLIDTHFFSVQNDAIHVTAHLVMRVFCLIPLFFCCFFLLDSLFCLFTVVKSIWCSPKTCQPANSIDFPRNKIRRTTFSLPISFFYF